jgi:hypothetical protein
MIINANLETLKYLAYENDDRYSEQINIPIDDSYSLDALVSRLEGGANIFDLIPQFTNRNLGGFRLKYLLCQTRDEMRIDDRTLVDSRGYMQYGKLFIPVYLVPQTYDKDKVFVLSSEQIKTGI